MGESKYGRLFTEADVRNAMLWAHIRGWQAGRHGTADAGAASSEVLLREFEEGGEVFGERLTFPADEPLFLLRAQDFAATAIFRPYADECERIGASTEYLDQVWRLYDEFMEFVHANRERVKAPD